MKKLLTFIIGLHCLISFGQGVQNDAFKATATGTNSYSVTINAITASAPYDGQKIWVKFGNANSGASTLKVTVAGAVSYSVQAITLNGSALVANDIIINQYIELIYYLAGTSWQMQKTGFSATYDWALNGNTVGSEKFIGTIDNFEFPIRTNNVERLRVTNAGGFWKSGTSNNIDITNRLLSDGSITSLSWVDRFLMNSGGSITVDWEGKQLKNTQATLDWGTNKLLGTSGETILNWSNTGIKLGHLGLLSGNMGFLGITSGQVTVQPLAAAGTYTLTLPPDDGAASTFLKTDGSGVLTFSTVALGTSTSGKLPLSQGGTNTNIASVAIGDLLVGDAGNSFQILPDVAVGKVLSSGGVGAIPTWSTPTSGWALLGNAGTAAGTNFVGTTDVQDLVFKTNSVENARFDYATNGHFSTQQGITSYGGFLTPTSSSIQIFRSGANGFITSHNGSARERISYQGADHLFETAGNGSGVQAIFNSTGLGVGNTTPSATIHAKGLGATSATYGLKVHNSTGTNNALLIRDDGAIFMNSIYGSSGSSVNIGSTNTLAQPNPLSVKDTYTGGGNGIGVDFTAAPTDGEFGTESMSGITIISRDNQGAAGGFLGTNTGLNILVRHQGTVNGTVLEGFAVRCSSANAATGTLSDSKTIFVQSFTKTGSGAVPTTVTGIHVENHGIGGATNSYAIRVAAQSGSTNNYGIVSADDRNGFGTIAPTEVVDVTGNIQTSGQLKLPKTNVTQITSATTSVTVTDGTSGIITTVSETLAAGASATFTVGSSSVLTTSIVQVTVQDYSGTFTTNGLPMVSVDNITNGTFDIVVSNGHLLNALSGVIKISYIVN